MPSNRPRIETRLAVPGDSTGIASTLQEAFAAYRPLYTAEAFAATTPTPEQIDARLNEGPVWVALRNKLIVGTVAAVPKGAGLYVRSMAVLPAAREKGTAGRLLKQVESFALAHGHKYLSLSTTPFLTDAIRLYEHSGFLRSDEGPHELFGTPLFTMVKLL
jgi:GNAT superfamily N-acetyltransferase